MWLENCRGWKSSRVDWNRFAIQRHSGKSRKVHSVLPIFSSLAVSKWGIAWERKREWCRSSTFLFFLKIIMYSMSLCVAMLPREQCRVEDRKNYPLHEESSSNFLVKFARLNGMLHVKVKWGKKKKREMLIQLNLWYWTKWWEDEEEKTSGSSLNHFYHFSRHWNFLGNSFFSIVNSLLHFTMKTFQLFCLFFFIKILFEILTICISAHFLSIVI